MKLVVDASVVVKWFVEEEGQAEAIAILERGDECFAPDLVLVEVAGALDKKFKTGSVTREQAFEAVTAVQSKMTMVAGTRLIEAALDLASELNHPVADCLYLACAVELDARLVTADKEFIDKIGRKGAVYPAVLLASLLPLKAVQNVKYLQKLLSNAEISIANVESIVGEPLIFLGEHIGSILPDFHLKIAEESVPFAILKNYLNNLTNYQISEINAICALGHDVYNDKDVRDISIYFRNIDTHNEWKNEDSGYIRSTLPYLNLGIEFIEKQVIPPKAEPNG